MDETGAYCIYFNVGKEDPAVIYLCKRLDLYKWKLAKENLTENTSVLLISPTIQALEISAERFRYLKVKKALLSKFQ